MLAATKMQPMHASWSGGIGGSVNDGGWSAGGSVSHPIGDSGNVTIGASGSGDWHGHAGGTLSAGGSYTTKGGITISGKETYGTGGHQSGSVSVDIPIG